jgi:hypothetical protein
VKKAQQPPKAAPAPAPVVEEKVWSDDEPVKEAEDDDSSSYVKVSSQDVQGYVPSDKVSDDDFESDDSDVDDDDDDYYDDFESKKKKDKAKKQRKMQERKLADEREKATAHIKDGERYFEGIVKKVEQLKGKGKPIYTLAAKKLYMKGKGKAAEMKGANPNAAYYPTSTGAKGQGKGSFEGGVAAHGKSNFVEPESEEESEDEVDADAKYDEWGDLIVDESKPMKQKKEKKTKKPKEDGLEMFPNSSAGFIPPEYDIPQDAAVLACPVCTFHNHIQNENCEICGASLEPPSKDEPSGPSRYIKEQQQAFKEEVRKNKGRGKAGKTESYEREVVVDGSGRIKVVTKTEDDVKKEKSAAKKKQLDTYEEDSDGDSEDDFLGSASKLAAAKKLNVGADFTSQFTGNGKLNPAAEQAIKEKNEREKRIEEERLAKEEKAYRKDQKRREKEEAEKNARDEDMQRLAEQAAKEKKASMPKKEKLKPAVKGQEGGW